MKKFQTLHWKPEKNELWLIDQRALPQAEVYMHCKDHVDVAEAIRSMVVRGAPAIGATAAYGMVLAAYNAAARDYDTLRNELLSAAEVLNASRPTAVNLSWAVKRMLRQIPEEPVSLETMFTLFLQEANRIAAEDIETNKQMAANGAALIEDGDTILHHCNTGALATVDWGTALGVIRMAHEMGKRIHVLVDETRPRLQGARLTAWELKQYGVPFDIISDGASGHFLRTGQVQKVFFGADRVAANGDVANKIGSYMLALAAHTNAVPVYSVFPTSTVDMSLAHGDLIPIEERSGEEVLNLQFQGRPATPSGASARNPAFDVTPHTLFTGLVTEKGVVYPPFSDSLRSIMEQDK
jgi:methylthioribose-1-phosphate isomerase